MADAALSQVGANLTGAVALVRDDVVGPGAWPAWTDAGNADGVQDLLEGSAVVDVPAGQNEGEWAAVSVADQVELGAQSASGSAEGVITRFVPLGDPFLPPAAC